MTPRPASGSIAGPAPRPSGAGLDTAAKRRLVWIAAGLGGLVFLLGTAAFALFFTLAPAPLTPSQEGDDVAGTPWAEGAGASASATLRPGGEFVHLVSEDINSFSPLYATGETAQLVMELLFPQLLGQDPMSGLATPTELAERWEVAADGRTYTFFLRNHITWSDGTPVTAEDFIYTYTALGNPALDSPYQSRTAFIESMHAPDPHTLVVTLTAPNCSALHSLRHPLLPSHVYAAHDNSADAGRDPRMHPLAQPPTLSAGPLRFESHMPGQSIVLARNPDYWKGAPLLERYILRVEPDPDVQASLLATGAAQLARIPAGNARGGQAWQSRQTGVETTNLYLYPQPGYLFLAANLADPSRPEPGRASLETAADSILTQSPHPILGDVSVRRALAMALDTGALLQSGWGSADSIQENDIGGGFALGGYLLPTVPWANPAPPAPVAHDLQQAGQLLENAGWRLEADNVRRRDGVVLALRLMTNEDNPRRVALAQAIAQQLAAAGVQVRVEPLAFERMAAELVGQRFDLSLGGWDNLAADPGLHLFWHSRDDIPGQGFNFVSFQDAEVDLWLDQALTLPGCAPDARGARYAQVQERVQSELPYLLLLGEYGGWAYRREWHNIEPGPWHLHYNVQNWGTQP